jgi:hypothetical protein
MNPLPEIVEKYLKKYSLSLWKLEPQLQNKVDNAIVIPVISEYDNLRKLLASLLKNDKKYFDRTALIFVINNFSDSSEEVKHDNQKSLNYLRMIIAKKETHDSLALDIINSNLNIVLIDASSFGFEMPKKIGGVGLARKIGMDEALMIFDYSSTAKNILICLDADCIIDPNFLTTIVDNFNNRKFSAAVVNFRHKINDDTLTTNAIICYEIFLRYYILGLKYADSPFAFHTIGSTIVCDHESYIKVEGMNKRKAAEDFYFLEKLAKNYKIEKITAATVYPSARSSWRVPFGTGQRVGRFLSKKENEYLLYDPSSFDVLKKWLKIFASDEIKSSNDYLESAQKIHPELVNFLMIQNFKNDWNGILINSAKPEQLAKQKLKWFDGFRTLKLIHYLRDKSFPLISMFEALNELFDKMRINRDFLDTEAGIPNLEVQKKYLEILRDLT